MDQIDHVRIVAQLRQAQRLMARGGLSLAEALEIVKLYEQGVASLLTPDRLVAYIEARMRLADSFLG